MLLAVVIPVYNEAELVRACVGRVLDTPPPTGCERLVVLVDDGSRDGSRDAVGQLSRENPSVTSVFHERNRGKGAAVRTGIAEALARGADLVLIHDADLEYDPADHAAACRPIIADQADAVIGDRFATGMPRTTSLFHRFVNRALTLMSNAATGLSLGDMECCTKAMSRRVAERVTIEEDRFGLEPEIVAKLARLRLPIDDPASVPASIRPLSGTDRIPASPMSADLATRPARIAQVPVRYAGRSHAQGKKIGWRDGVRAIRCIVKYR